MAYTPLLGLSLPVTGTLSGTWGDEINNSITSLVDSAVAGTTTLSTDADVTLTTTGGVSNTAREAILLCSGARTGVRYITAPATSKTYTVINATTGGYNVYIRGAGPTAGIAVPMGYSVKVAWNGSDFVQMSVPVSNVSGLGTGVATALGISVGTAGSPVVNGGALGTPSSGTITNLTGTANITATGGASGAIAATTLSASSTVSGTGFSTYLASPPAIGGTAPASVSATALSYTTTLTGGTGIVNLGAGQFYKDASGNVGIGTSSPGAKLDVNGIVRGSGGLQLAINTDINFNSGTDSNNRIRGDSASGLLDVFGFNGQRFYTTNGGSAERMRIDSSGNVGIGTSSPYSKLHVSEASNATVTLGATPTTGYYSQVYQNGNNLDLIANGDQAYRVSLGTNNGSGLLRLFTAGGTTGNTERMRIDSSGNVGIGTTSPNQKLAIATANTVTGSRGNVYFYTTDTATADYGAQLTLGGSYSGTSEAPFGSIAGRFSGGINGYLQFGTLTAGSITEKMRIDASGNVGIGTTSPQAKLDFGAGATGRRFNVYNDTTNAISGFGTDIGGGAYELSAYAGGNGANLGQFTWSAYNRTANTYAERMRIDSSGNVGIGTTSPGMKLDVSGSIRATGQNLPAAGAGVEIVYGSSLGYIYPYDRGTSSFKDMIVDGANVRIQTNGVEKLRITSGGDVTVSTAALLGYGTGSGGTVTQATDKSTSVTLNKPTGQVTMNNAALASGAVVSFTLNNTLVSQNDTIIINIVPLIGLVNPAEYQLWAGPQSGSIKVCLQNIAGGSLSQALAFNFAVIKGATS